MKKNKQSTWKIISFVSILDKLLRINKLYAVSIRTVTYEYLRAICTALSRDGKDY